MNTQQIVDIPNVDLIKRLRQGWSVRGKHWEEGLFITEQSPLGRAITVDDLRKAKWEGIPAQPSLLANGKHGLDALKALIKGTFGDSEITHIRREEWYGWDIRFPNGKFALRLHDSEEEIIQRITLDHIIETDWEIWGYEE